MIYLQVCILHLYALNGNGNWMKKIPDLNWNFDTLSSMYF